MCYSRLPANDRQGKANAGGSVKRNLKTAAWFLFAFIVVAWINGIVHTMKVAS
jgi:hypothetical protein